MVLLITKGTYETVAAKRCEEKRDRQIMSVFASTSRIEKDPVSATVSRSVWDAMRPFASFILRVSSAVWMMYAWAPISVQD